jgi:ferredoxin-NADP reductase
MKFETAIQAVIVRNPNVISLRFPRPAELSYKAGQYFFLTLKHQGKEVTHPFSFSSSPTTAGYVEFTKKLSDSEYSSALRAAKVGDWARLDASYGTFTFEGEHPKIALLAGGIGITPFMSICQYATDKALDTKIVLFYANRNPSEVAFKDELDALAKRNPNLQINYVMSQPPPEWTGPKGYISADMVEQMLPECRRYVYYTCGPPPMVKAMQDLVAKLGLPKEQLKLEFFSGYTQP